MQRTHEVLNLSTSGCRISCVFAQYMLDEFKKQEGVDLSTDKMAMQRLKEAAEKAKKELSSATTTNINLPFITATAEGPKHFDMNLTRAKFDELTAHLVERTAGPVNSALNDAGMTASELSKVLFDPFAVAALESSVSWLSGMEVPFTVYTRHSQYNRMYTLRTFYCYESHLAFWKRSCYNQCVSH